MGAAREVNGKEIGGRKSGIGQQDNSKCWLGERERARNEGYVCMPIATSKRVTIVSVMGNASATGHWCDSGRQTMDQRGSRRGYSTHTRHDGSSSK